MDTSPRAPAVPATPTPSAPSTPPAPSGTVAPRAAPAGRLRWLDNLRLALTVLVVLHHALQPYGPADWWYVEGGRRNGALATLSAWDGTFFMALFFFVSAHLMPDSVDRRGAGRFLGARLLRLGVPTLVGALTLVPGLMYAYYVHYRDYPPLSFPRYYADVYLGLGERPADWTGPFWPDLQFGHLWFIQNLLAYSLLYVLCRQAARLARLARRGRARRVPPRRWPAPGHRHLACLIPALAAVTFAVRLRYPLDTWVAALGFLQVEPARLPQYATFFALGLLAGRQDWLRRLDARTGLLWLAGGLAGTALLFAVGAHAPCFGPGGANAPSALWALYDSALCVSLSAGLLVLFREAVTGGGRLRAEGAASSYAVYLLHVPLVVAAQYALAGHVAQPVAAWALTALLALPAAFAAAAALRRLPGLRRVL
ncbi:acyltransferase family protein [Streptomyces hoynatensis]|uniref:Acyltransferase n=1 Tax=Streptomyces hoynatensis TaxID=1141874 RepID=A0A3A9YSL4_9ACTN|nr:acyltransferase [Streptomyces hoynatensis]RKN39028.1 acyltransferase [Streptomyces hoynatensis]